MATTHSDPDQATFDQRQWFDQLPEKLLTQYRLRDFEPRKYPDEFRERAVRPVMDAKDDAGSVLAACTRVGEQLGINADTLRGWVKQVEIDAGTRPGRGPGRRPKAGCLA